MSATVSPIYSRCFSEAGPCLDWTNFNSKFEDFKGPISAKGREVDFSVDARTWKDTSLKVISWKVNAMTVIGFGYAVKNRASIKALLSQKNTSIIHPILAAAAVVGIYKVAQAIRYVVSRISMIPLYPLQSRIVCCLVEEFSAEKLDSNRTAHIAKDDQVSRHVILEKDGIRYSGILKGLKESINNGKWILQATANCETIEKSDFFDYYAEAVTDYNVLMINGPHCGRSEGHATPKTMGEAQEVGLQFLETAIKAKRIVIAGRSIGGMAVGEAIVQHKFKKKVAYLAIRQMTFDRISNVSRQLLGLKVVNLLIKALGLESDSVAASKKLQAENIREVIIQCTSSKEVPESKDDFKTDGPIHAHASLARRLIKMKMTEQKTFIGLPQASHMSQASIQASVDSIKLFDQELDSAQALLSPEL